MAETPHCRATGGVGGKTSLSIVPRLDAGRILNHSLLRSLSGEKQPAEGWASRKPLTPLAFPAERLAWAHPTYSPWACQSHVRRLLSPGVTLQGMAAFAVTLDSDDGHVTGEPAMCRLLGRLRLRPPSLSVMAVTSWLDW